MGLGGPRWVACHTLCNSCLVWQVATGNLFFISTAFCQINTRTNWISSPLIVFLALLSLCSHQMSFLKLTLLHSSAANRSLQWIVRPGSLFVPTKRARRQDYEKFMRALMCLDVPNGPLLRAAHPQLQKEQQLCKLRLCPGRNYHLDIIVSKLL